jgi:hypothetical protein
VMVLRIKLWRCFLRIEVSRHQNNAVNALDLSFKLGNKGNRKLKSLFCLVNYDMKGGHSNRRKGKGRDSNCSL